MHNAYNDELPVPLTHYRAKIKCMYVCMYNLQNTSSLTVERLNPVTLRQRFKTSAKIFVLVKQKN